MGSRKIARRTVSNPGPAQIFVLQGPVGAFFDHLSSHLRGSGYSVLDVCFNLGDRLWRGGENLIWHRRGLAAWRQELLRLCRLHRPRCFIMCGDRRPVHIVACEVAALLGIRVYSFEEGYLRPDYITFEEGGNNALSSIAARLPDFDDASPISSPRATGRSFGRMGRRAFLYQWALAIGRPMAPGYVHHRQRKLVAEALLWTRAWWRKLAHEKSDAALVRALATQHEKRYFVVALQVHDDLQGLHHGAGWTQEKLIVTSIRSFARRAPADARLVIRCHPLDRGHKTYHRLVECLARAEGVRDRVVLMLNGHAPTILTHAAGFISVNSTMAMSAMHHQCPVFAFGDCFYRLAGLVADGRDEAALDRFWVDPPPVDMQIFSRFRALVASETQINGNYYLRRFYPAMSAAVVSRLIRDGVVARTIQSPLSEAQWIEQPESSAVPAE